jgi:hypothetical protein
VIEGGGDGGGEVDGEGGDGGGGDGREGTWPLCDDVTLLRLEQHAAATTNGRGKIEQRQQMTRRY